MTKEEGTKTTIQAMIFSQAFLDNMDKLELAPQYKHRVKLKGKAFIKELDSFMNAAYGNCGDTESNLINLMDKCQKQVETTIENELLII